MKSENKSGENKTTAPANKSHSNKPGKQENSKTGKPNADLNIQAAASSAADDISKDPDLAPDETNAADLDEGELARFGNSTNDTN